MCEFGCSFLNKWKAEMVARTPKTSFHVGNPWMWWRHHAAVEKPSNFRNIKSQKPHFDLIRTALSCPKRNIQILENAPWIFSERFASSMWRALTTERPHRCTCTSKLWSSCITMTISSEPPHWSETKRIPVVKQVDFSGRKYRLMHRCITNSKRENSKTP